MPEIVKSLNWQMSSKHCHFETFAYNPNEWKDMFIQIFMTKILTYVSSKSELQVQFYSNFVYQSK